MAAVAAALSILTLLALRGLPYSTAELERVDFAATVASPSGAELALGSVLWDLTAYRSAEELEPLRRHVAGTCPASMGLAAAKCLSDSMASQFGHGTPPFEPFDATYDPVASLSVHVGGHPGHCVTRSSLIVAALLATGTPARMLQLIRRDGIGHNVLEVWEDGRWVVFDPTFGVGVSRTDRAAPLLGAGDIEAGGRVSLVPLSQIPPGAPDTQTFYPEDVKVAFEGARIYPEPWLYTRVGHRAAAWPMRARFAITGAASSTLGPLQTTLRGLFVALATIAAGCCVAALRRRMSFRSRRAEARAVEVATPHQVPPSSQRTREPEPSFLRRDATPPSPSGA